MARENQSSNPFEKYFGDDADFFMKLSSLPEHGDEVVSSGSRLVGVSQSETLFNLVNSGVEITPRRLTEYQKSRGYKLFDIRNGLISFMGGALTLDGSFCVVVNRNMDLDFNGKNLLDLTTQKIPNLLGSNPPTPQSILNNTNAFILKEGAMQGEEFHFRNNKKKDEFVERMNESSQIKYVRISYAKSMNGEIPFTFSVQRKSNIFETSELQLALSNMTPWNKDVIQWCLSNHKEISNGKMSHIDIEEITNAVNNIRIKEFPSQSE